MRGAHSTYSMSQHNWGDSNLYLRRNTDDSISLTIEHRSERAPPALDLELASNQLGPFHQIITQDSSLSAKLSPDQKIIEILRGADADFPFARIRAETKLRTQVVSTTLNTLVSSGSVVRSKNGYALAI